ncbi:hypothetical protein [Methylocella tundrae]|uniref:hypothetical protein n=1 Tax=Methylocella tundrae TaxID=227605 RepID=UPI001FCE6ACE|nr:hypothetical protein [Methylocella tundrae]WPP06045.1 hypothetical protein SIN04_09675 [Methylocella tundrae]
MSRRALFGDKGGGRQKPIQFVIQASTNSVRGGLLIQIHADSTENRAIEQCAVIAEIDVKVFGFDRQIVGDCILEAATNGPASTRRGGNRESGPARAREIYRGIYLAIGKAAGCINKKPIPRVAEAPARCAEIIDLAPRVRIAAVLARISRPSSKARDRPARRSFRRWCD